MAETMRKEGHRRVAVFSDELDMDQRIEIITKFRDGKYNALIATNVLARGIDVEQVNFVVNFDLPVDPSGRADYDTYIHRIGRTGRFGKHGVVINLVDGPRALKVVKQIEDHFSKSHYSSLRY